MRHRHHPRRHVTNVEQQSCKQSEHEPPCFFFVLNSLFEMNINPPKKKTKFSQPLRNYSLQKSTVLLNSLFWCLCEPVFFYSVFFFYLYYLFLILLLLISMQVLRFSYAKCFWQAYNKVYLPNKSSYRYIRRNENKNANTVNLWNYLFFDICDHISIDLDRITLWPLTHLSLCSSDSDSAQKRRKQKAN